MANLDGIAVPAIMGLVLAGGVAAAVMLTRDNEPDVEAVAPTFTGVLKPQGTVRLKTQTAATTSEETARGFIQAPASE